MTTLSPPIVNRQFTQGVKYRIADEVLVRHPNPESLVATVEAQMHAEIVRTSPYPGLFARERGELHGWHPPQTFLTETEKNFMTATTEIRMQGISYGRNQTPTEELADLPVLVGMRFDRMIQGRQDDDRLSIRDPHL